MNPLLQADRDFLMAEKIRLERENAELRAALQTAITDAYDARLMMAAREFFRARSALCDSCKKMEAALK